MTNQMQGEVLFAGWSGSASGDWVYTPWMPVRGDIGTFGVQVLQRNTVTLTWNVETRTLESPTTEALFASNRTVSSITTDTGTNTGGTDVPAKELVRYRFHTGATANTTDFVVMRALQPAWRVNR
jgi:hypothetical protein